MRCLLVYPEFRSASFWNYRTACRLRGVKYPGAPLGLLTVAAMLPAEWDCRLVDRNVEPLDVRAIDWADIVMIGGMIFQQVDHLALIELARSRGKRVVCGGPDVTNSPHLYDGATSLVLGEAEETLPLLLADLARGVEPRHVYSSEARADMRRSPVPRWDLVDARNYLYLALQWSRGCPFLCEFCDIIELFGRVPRTKSPEQVLAELERIYQMGYRGTIDIVDDNFIGNQKLVRELLPAIVGWQQAHGYPFEFSTQASLNLADNDRILSLMQAAGFVIVFIGIETPNDEALARTRKKQNAGRDMAVNVRRLYDHGIIVIAGFIVGIDGEGDRAAEEMIACIHETAVPVCMVNLMFALPSTQLARRLASEGRLWPDFDRVADDTDPCVSAAGGGLNFDTSRPRSEVLGDYIRVLREAYAPRAYFDRVTRMGRALNVSGRKLGLGLPARLNEIATLLRCVRAIGLRKPWRARWWRLLLDVLLHNPWAFRHVFWMGVLFEHFDSFSQYLIAHLEVRRARAIAEEQAASHPV